MSTTLSIRNLAISSVAGLSAFAINTVSFQANILFEGCYFVSGSNAIQVYSSEASSIKPVTLTVQDCRLDGISESAVAISFTTVIHAKFEMLRTQLVGTNAMTTARLVDVKSTVTIILPFGYFVGRVGILSSRDGIKGFVWKLKLEAILRRPFDYIL